MLIKNLGQISLPRLHKLNNGVFFESLYLAKTELWQSIKIYLFLWQFITIFQFESLLLYKYTWNGSSIVSFLNFNISKNFLYNPIQLSSTLQNYLPLTLPLTLNFYLVYIGGTYYAIIFMWPVVRLGEEESFLSRKVSTLPLNTLLYY